MAENYTADIPINLNIVAKAITSGEVTKASEKELEKVSQAISRTVLNPEITIDVKAKQGAKAQKMLVSDFIKKLQLQIETSKVAPELKESYKKLNEDIVAALSAVSGKYDPKVRAAMDEVLGGKSLESFDKDTQKQVKKFEIAYRKRLKAIQQALTSSESIFNFAPGENGKGTRLMPIINENLSRELQRQLETLKQFERATNSVYAQREARRDAELAFAKSRAHEWEKLRKANQQAPETFDLRGAEEAYRKLRADARMKRMLTTDAAEKLRLQGEMAQFEKELSAIGNRRRELAGSTLGKSIEEASLASSRSSKAKRFYETRFMDAPSGSLEKATYALRAKSEAQTALSQAKLVLSKTDPNADQSARERVDLLTKEKIALDALVASEEKHFKAQVKGTEAQRAAVAKQQEFIRESAKARILLDEMANLEKGTGDFLLNKQRLQTSLGSVRSLGRTLGGTSLDQSQYLLAEAESIGIKLNQKAADQKKVVQQIERDAKVTEKLEETRTRVQGAVPSFKKQVSDLKAGGLNSFYTLMQKDSQGAVGALSQLKLLREDIMSSYQDAKRSGLRDERKELKALEMQLGQLIKSYTEFDRAANKPAREMRRSAEAPKVQTVSAAAIRRAEKERIRQALISQGELAFQEVGGMQNYARIPRDQYESAKEAALASQNQIKLRMASVEGDSSLSSGDKRRALKELNLEFIQASRAAKYLQSEINGNVGVLRQLTLASKAFFRYFVLYGGAYQVIGYFREMGRALVDFQDSLKATQVIAQASRDDMISIGEAIRGVASTTGQSLQTVSNAAQTLAQAGVETKNIPAALKAVSDFALATGSSLETASEVITSAKEIFQGDMTFGGAADQLTRAVNISKLKAEDLRTIFNLGAQTAQVSGLTSGQFLGASATLSNLGIKSSTVATGLRQLLLELFNPDEKTMDFLRKRYNQLGEMRSDTEIRNLYRGFQRSDNPLMDALTELRRIGAAGTAQDDFRRVLDIRAENVALPLLKRLDDLAKNIARVSETGAAATGAADRVDTLRKAFEQLGVKAQLLGESILDSVSDPLQDFAKGLGGFIDQIIAYRDKLGREGGTSIGTDTTAAAGAVVGGAIARRYGAGGILTGVGALAGAAAAEGGVKGVEAIRDPETASLLDKAIKALAIFSLITGPLKSFGTSLIGFAAKAKDALKPMLLAGGIEAGAEAGKAMIAIRGLGFLVTKLNPWGILASLVAAAYSVYELFGEVEKGRKSIDVDVVRKDIAKAQKDLEAAKDELKSFDPTVRGSRTNLANEALRSVTEFQSTLDDLFGKSAAQAQEALKALGDAPIEADSELSKKVRATLQNLWKKPFNERDFSRLSKAQAEFTRAQGFLVAESERLLKKAADLTSDPQAALTQAEQRFLAAYNQMRNSPLFKPDTFNPENMVNSLMDLFQLMDLEVKAAQGKIDRSQAQVRASQDLLATDTVNRSLDPAKPITLQNQQITRAQIVQNPTQEGISELKSLQAAYQGKVRELEGQLTSGQVLSREEFTNLDKQLTTAKAELEAVTKEITDAQTGLLAKTQREAKAKEEQVVQQEKDDKARQEAEDAAREATKKEAALTLLRTETATKLKNLDDQILEAKAKKEWSRLLDNGGLLDQEYDVRKKVLTAERDLVAMELRQAAGTQGVSLDKNATDVNLTQREQLIAKPETKSLLEQLDKANEELKNANAEYLKDRAQIGKDALQVAPFVQSVDYERRLNRIDDLRNQLLDVREKGGEDALKMQKEIYDLEMQNLQEQLADVERQKASYDAQGPGRYENAKDRVENKMRELRTKFDKDYQQSADKRAITDLRNRIKQLEQEKKRLESLREQTSTGPLSTRQQTLTIMGRTPMAVGTTAAPSQYDPLFSKYERQYPQIPQGLLKAIASVESNFNPNRTSSKGAMGLMQLMPDTARRTGVSDPFNPEESVMGAAKTLEWLLKYFNGNVEKSIQGYNTSFKNVDSGRISAETRAYLPKVMAAWRGQGVSATGGMGLRSWDEFPYIDQDGTGGSDVTGKEKFQKNAPQVYQAIIGGAMKWVEEQGGKSKVMIRDLGRGAGDKGNHSMGVAGDIQLVDRNGRVIPNYQPKGDDFRAYEQFWQDGAAYAMGIYGPELENYFRAGAYFSSTGPGAKPGDAMHADISMLFNEERKRLGKKPAVMPGGGSLRDGANDTLKALFPTIVSKGIPEGDWDAYRRARFGEGIATGGMASTTIDMPVFSRDGLSEIGRTSAEIGRIDDEIAKLELEVNRITGGGIEGAAAIREKQRTERAANSAKEQQAMLDNLRGTIQNSRQQLETSQAFGLPTGPQDTAIRETAGTLASPQMYLDQLTRNEGFMSALVLATQEALNKAVAQRRGVATRLEAIDARLQDPNLSEEARKSLEADKAQRIENLKSYDAAIIEFNRDISETSRLLFANRQEQQMFSPSLFGKSYQVPVLNKDGTPVTREVTGPDGERYTENKVKEIKTQGQLDQVSLDNLLGRLNELDYAFNKLGKNINNFITNVIDTFVTKLAESIMNGFSNTDQAALNQTRAELNAAIADASYQRAVNKEQLNQANDYLDKNPNGIDSGIAKARRDRLQSAYQDSVSARNQAIQAANENARAQEGNGMGGAFSALAKEGATTLLKTAILSPIQSIFGAFAGTKDGSTQDRALWVRDANSKGPLGAALDGADSKEGGKDTAGGILDETIQDAEGFFSSIGDGFSGMFSTISGWASTAWNVISGLFSSGSGSGGGSIWGSLLGGAMGMFGFANGGHVKGPGTGTSDSIPAWLSNGEYVLTSREVDAIGVKNIERWKEAMKSPAKFSTGGLVSTFESASRSMAKSSNMSDTGSTSGGTVVNVIDQRSAANSSPVEATKSRGPDGKDMISIMVKDAVKNAINSGALDRTMAANYGSRRMGGSR